VRCADHGRKLALAGAVALACLGIAPRGLADELTLRSGQNIVGNIVGFENNMFRVETEFGVALVRKDKVVSIKVSPGTTAESGAKRTPPKPKTEDAKGGETAGTQAGPPATGASAAVAPSEAAAKPSPPPVSRPIDEPLPAHLQEHVEGNTYVNDTFQFAMYKPPGWKIYEGVPKETGSGITAIGTEDEHTLLIVDRQVWSGAPDVGDDRVEARLRRTYQEYRKLSEEKTTCDGHPAVRREFTGLLDGAEWHGVAVHVARGNTVFGLIGLTSAETYEFQQAVLNKIANSFHFLSASAAAKPEAPQGSSP